MLTKRGWPGIGGLMTIHLAAPPSEEKGAARIFSLYLMDLGVAIRASERFDCPFPSSLFFMTLKGSGAKANFSSRSFHFWLRHLRFTSTRIRLSWLRRVKNMENEAVVVITDKSCQNASKERAYALGKRMKETREKPESEGGFALPSS
jgi:hypothetical protein